MKYRINDILYFVPTYSQEKKYCQICQVVKYFDESNKYLVITHDIYCPCHYNKSIVKEEDLTLTTPFQHFK